MINSPENISKRIARYRNLAGYTQERAAAALGINKNAYARMERNGTPKPEMLKMISDLYNVSVQALLYGENADFGFTNDEKAAVLKSDTPTIRSEEALILTANEKNAVKLCRTLTPEQRSEVLKLIADYVESRKPQEQD